MPTLPLRPTLVRLLLPAMVVVGLSVAAGWWLGQRQVSRPAPVDPRRAALTREAAELRQRVKALNDTPRDRQRLLELLVGLERKAEAITLLEGWADQEPERWSLRLMLAELRRDQGDHRGAERELRQILHQRPAQMEALQLMSLVLLEQGRGAEAEVLVKAATAASAKEPAKAGAVEQGLLLAEIRQRRGSPAAAEATYRELMEAFPSDRRPALALALLRQQRGQLKGALEALDQARERGGPDATDRTTLDRLAASWRLKALRQSPLPQAGAPSPAAPPAPRAEAGAGSEPPAP
ncbi:MAG: tetratricopeptide repeat protein [Cyanobacteriota bacterium]|nr:tetratricopeptide repeat protein [Cyanobacteriota bacterium]